MAQDYASPALVAAEQGRAYSGIGRLRASSQCTAFLIRTAGSGPAYVVTNGHCVGLLGANEVIVNREQTAYRFTPGLFFDAAATETLGSRRIAYATMKRTDIAVIELDARLEELTARGYAPLEFGSAAAGERVMAAGAPVQNTPMERMFLQLGRCRLGPRVDVVEFRWLWRGLIRNDCPDILPGWSGAPLISQTSGRVVGVMNTTTIHSFSRGGGFDCYLGTPCEVGAAQRVLDDASYGVGVEGLERCFDGEGVFRLGLGCPLDPGRQVEVTRRPATRAERPGARWNASVAIGDLAGYRYKVFREGRGDCGDAAGYSAPTTAGHLDEVIGSEPGRYYLCVNGEGVDPAWAAVLHVRIDAEPPVVPLPYTLRETDAAYVMEIIGIPSEVSLGEWKAGAPASVNCADREGYRPYLRVPVRLLKAEGPYRVCLVAYDDAGNATPVTELLLDGMRILPRGVVNAASFVWGPVAPGGHVAVFGIGFPGSGLRAAVVGGGRRWEARLTYASQQQVNVVLPGDLPVGDARLILVDADGRMAEAEVMVEPSAPGLYRVGNAAAAVLLRPDGVTAPAFVCRGNGPCQLDGLEPGGGVLEVYGTGLRGVGAAWVGVLPLEVLEVAQGEGFDRVRLRLPDGFSLRGYQHLQVSADGRKSEPVWLWFR